MASRHLTVYQRNNFKRVIAQLERVRTDNGILRIIKQAQALLDEVNIGWDALQLYLPADYAFKNQRRTVAAVAKVTAAMHPAANGTYPLGRDGRALLKMAVTKHADWPLVREMLGLEISNISIADLIAVAQLLRLDDRFVAMFSTMQDPPAQDDLPFNETNNTGE